MIITAWVLLITFGFIGLAFLRKLFLSKLNGIELFLLIFSIIIAAISAGTIFGGLLT